MIKNTYLRFLIIFYYSIYFYEFAFLKKKFF